jgi:hypothetical protein
MLPKMISYGNNNVAGKDSASQGCSHREMMCQYSDCFHAVVHFVEALRYKLEGRAFHTCWDHLNFSLT